MTVTHHESEMARERLEPLQAFPRRRQAFSLIEICIALGIVAFAFVALLGLLPVGLANYTVAMNTQTSTEIYQRIASELQETEFDTLLKPTSYVSTGGVVGSDSNLFFAMKLRYFDAEGQEVKVLDPAAPSDSEKKLIVYTARIRGSFPGDADPTKHDSNYFTSLPSVSGARFNPRDSMFFQIQVVLSTGRDISGIIDKPTFMILPDVATKAGFSLRTYSIIVTRNAYNLNPT